MSQGKESSMAGWRSRGARMGSGRGRRLARAAAASALLGTAALLPDAPPASSQTASTFVGHARNIRVVGHNDLGGQGLNGEVTVVGTTAVVGAGYTPQNITELATNKTAALNVAPPCVTVPVKVVDL